LISFWLDNPVGGAPNEFQLWWNGRVLFDQTNLPSFGWTNLQFLGLATSNQTELKFGFRQDVDAFGLDDVGVLAVPAPAFAAINTVSNNIVLDCNAWQGLTYQIQYATNLGSEDWRNLGQPVIATNTVISFTDVLPLDQQRFYRVIPSP